MSSQRRHVYHADARTFSDARMECVVHNGDLPSIENDQDLDNVVSNITAAPASSATNSTSNTGLNHDPL